MHRKYMRVAMLLVSLIHARSSLANDHAAILPFVDDQVVAIAYVNLRQLDLPSAVNELRQFETFRMDLGNEADALATLGQRWITALRASGASYLYVLLRPSDIAYQSPIVVLSLEESADPEVAIRRLRETIGAQPPFATLAKEVRVIDRVIDRVIVTAIASEPLKSVSGGASPERMASTAAALNVVGDGTAGFLLIGNEDSRRVLREMLPRLPKPFAAIDGRLLADHVTSIGGVVRLPPHLSATIRLDTTSQQTAELLHGAAIDGISQVKDTVKAKLSDTATPPMVSALTAAIESLKPQVEGNSLICTWGDNADELGRLDSLLAPFVFNARKTAFRQQRMNSFKQLALAAVNYESVHASFVERASYDADGRPLLSWRVHLLPYLDQEELYKQFHLEEPWDSPHNAQLIERMPNVFSDPDPRLRSVNAAGRTTYVAPVAAETMFPDRQSLPEGLPLKIRDVKDGSSRTILFVEAVPANAVIWTKPDDWDVPANGALDELITTERDGFVAAFCDGHVRFITKQDDPEGFPGLLTRAGGEPVR